MIDLNYHVVIKKDYWFVIWSFAKISTQYRLHQNKQFQEVDTVSTYKMYKMYKMLAETYQTNGPNENSD